jgi:hypothetical protein
MVVGALHDLRHEFPALQRIDYDHPAAPFVAVCRIAGGVQGAHRQTEHSYLDVLASPDALSEEVA